ncbi:MAG: exodeoxyribonuclease VII large subunit [Alphaproteobacteria bacterium]|nr:exodeoxyribonuclease VII large subunit [Alphaproteobacteria bacterium]
MADLDSAPVSRPNLAEYTVGEISHAIRRALETDFAQVRVRGEITGYKRAGSGHAYFRLKDSEAVLDAVAWRGAASKLAIQPEDGLDVVVTGRITAYAGRSSYQIVVESIELAGEGALLKLLEERRKRLAGEGLFDTARKRPLPFLPDVIGVVTSPTGAVIRDILHRLRDRFPRHVLIWPVLVQGQGAAEQVAAAIDGFNRLTPGGPVPRPDLLIVARGGGSLEDLMAFNEEIVVRAAAGSTIPLIAAVGHETDTTLIDHAADRRAPTPSAAAEMAVPVRAELVAQVLDRARRLVGATERLVVERRHRIEGLARGLPDPRALIETAAQRLDGRAERQVTAIGTLLDRHRAKVDRLGALLRHPREQIAEKRHALARAWQAAVLELHKIEANKRGTFTRLAAGERLEAGTRRRLTDARTRLGHVANLLDSVSYRAVLRRGFALVRHAGEPITAVAQTAPGLAIQLVFQDGQVGATIDPPGTEDAKPPARRPRRSSGGDQGSLL